MTTYIRKDSSGSWSATTHVDLTPELRLKLSTHKTFNGQVVTVATVVKVNGIHEIHALYKDFSRRLEGTKYPRITSKVVEEQHNRHNIEALALEARAFYGL